MKRIVLALSLLAAPLTAQVPLPYWLTVVQPGGTTPSGLSLVSGTALPINIRDFGAKCDGVTDDAQAIQRAMNSIPIQGGRLYTPAGAACMVSTTITAPTDRLVELWGDVENANSGGLVSEGSIWKRIAGATGPLLTQNGGATATIHGIQIYHMVFDGNNQSNDLVAITGSQGFRVAYTTFFNANGNGLIISGPAFNFYLDFDRFFELGNTTAFPNGTSALAFSSTSNGGVVDGWITQPHFESGRGSYLTAHDPTGTHPVDGITLVGGKMEWSGNNATGFNPPAASAICMPFMIPEGSDWNVFGTFFANGNCNAATHLRLQNIANSRFYTNHITASGQADNQLPTFFVDIFSGNNIFVSGIFTRGASSGSSGADIRVVESSVTSYLIDPGSQYNAPASGVSIKYTNPTTGKAGQAFFNGGIQDKQIALTGAASTAIDVQDANLFTITVGSNIAVVVQPPTGNPPSNQSQLITVIFRNTSGGALTTAPTFSAAAGGFKFTAGSIVNPTNGTEVAYTFRWDPTQSFWYEVDTPIATPL